MFFCLLVFKELLLDFFIQLLTHKERILLRNFHFRWHILKKGERDVHSCMIQILNHKFYFNISLKKIFISYLAVGR